MAEGGGYSLRYRPPGLVAAEFLKSRPAAGEEDLLPIEIIVGPIGSGKTGADMIRILCHAMEQWPDRDGWRRSKWAVVRNTNPMLETTTIASWLDWFPEDVFGKFNWSPPYSHTIRFEEQRVELEVIFLALDRPEQARNFLSLEVTGIYFNELREIPRELVIAGRSRCGRYPSLRHGRGAKWAGVIADSNYPEDELHYLCFWAGWTQPPDWMDAATRRLMFKPKGITFFEQAPAMRPVRNQIGDIVDFEANPAAENLKNLRPGYYQAQLSGNTTAWVLNMLCCEVARATESRPVQPEFRDHVHVAKRPLHWEPGAGPLLVGMDGGRTPAIICGQLVDGQIRILKEYLGQNVSVRSHVEATLPKMNVEFEGWADSHWRMKGTADPSGGGRRGGDEKTEIIHAREAGLSLVPAWTNDPRQRQGALERRLTTMSSGQPSIVFCPAGCPTVIQGMRGAYRFRRLRGVDGQFTEEVDKNMHSHPCEATEYLVMGVDRGSMKSDREQREAARGYQQANGRVAFNPFLSRRVQRQRR